MTLPPPGSPKRWTGAAVVEARAYVLARTPLPTPCAKCRMVIYPGDPWVVGHRLPRSSYPHLTWDPMNWAIECRRCSNRQGGQIAGRARRAHRTMRRWSA